MEHGSIGHNTGLVDVLVSVPLVVKPPASWPGTPSARVAGLVELRSVPAAIGEAAGAADGPGGPSLVLHLVGLAAPRRRPAPANGLVEWRFGSC